jgi:D-amino-acid dehydrogenase
MRIAVVGAGIVGVTTAYELAAQGHEVTVLERRGSVAEETSFANAGVLATACVMPWAAPGMPWKVLSRLLSRDASAHLGGVGALAQLPWIWRWWRGCRPAVHAANRGAMLALAQLSRQRMQELTHTLRLEYEQAPGFTVLLRSERELRRAAAGIKLLQSLGVAHEVIDAQRCRQIEPALNPDARLHAAIHLPQDGVGNCRHFAHLLKSEAQRLGAVFRFDSPVSSLAAGAQPALRLAGGEAITTDAVVVCAGVQANTLLSAVGLRLPLAPVHGYSVTAPLRHTEGHTSLGPRSAVLDDRHRVTISRLGQRVRVAGGAELGGPPTRQRMAALRTLYRVLDEWFPGAALAREAQHWKGARPMLPDGPPVLGASGAPGVWLNLGHGASGWTLACGSARVLAEAIAGREAPLDVSRLGLARLR